MSIDQLVSECASAVNAAASLVAKAPFKTLAGCIVTMDPVAVNATMYSLMGQCLTSTAWNTAKTDVTKHIKKLGFVWKKDRSGPHWQTRDKNKKPFAIERKAEADEAKASEAKEAEAEHALLAAQAAKAEEYQRLMLDRETTEEVLVNNLLSELERLNLDKAKALKLLTAAVKVKKTQPG